MTSTKIETKEIATIRRAAWDDVARDLVVTNEASAQNANELLVFVAGAKKKLEEQRVSLVKPLNDHVKNINAQFKEWVKPLDTADSVVRRKVLDFQKEQKAIRLEAERLEQERLERLAEVPEGLLDDLPEDLPDLPAPVSRTIEGSSGSTGVRKTWAFEVTDDAAIPREYLTVDEGAIGLAIRKGVREIPGVRIYQQESLSVRAR